MLVAAASRDLIQQARPVNVVGGDAVFDAHQHLRQRSVRVHHVGCGVGAGDLADAVVEGIVGVGNAAGIEQAVAGVVGVVGERGNSR